jgi:hypothetical protein
MKKILFYISGALTIIWGISHLFPTAGVVEGFGEITHDNKLIITMEWITEGLTLIFLGVLTIMVTMIKSGGKLANNIYISIICMLFAMAILSLFTGFRINFLPFRLCPVIFSASAILIILGIRFNNNSI